MGIQWRSVSHVSSNRSRRLAAVGAKPFDANEFRKATLGAAPGQHREDVDRLGDQRAGDVRDGFEDELFEAVKCRACGAGVDRADPAGVAGSPGLQEIERLRACLLYTSRCV